MGHYLGPYTTYELAVRKFHCRQVGLQAGLGVRVTDRIAWRFWGSMGGVVLSPEQRYKESHFCLSYMK